MRTELLTTAHLADVAEIERLCFAAPWSETALAVLCGEGAFGAVAVETRAVAYAGVIVAADEGQITNVATHPAARRRGCAAAVLERVFEEARARGLSALFLEVRESNAAAISLYRRFGFAVVGRRPRFYSHPTETALVMRAAVRDMENGETV